MSLKRPPVPDNMPAALAELMQGETKTSHIISQWPLKCQLFEVRKQTITWRDFIQPPDRLRRLYRIRRLKLQLSVEGGRRRVLNLLLHCKWSAAYLCFGYCQLLRLFWALPSAETVFGSARMLAGGPTTKAHLCGDRAAHQQNGWGSEHDRLYDSQPQSGTHQQNNPSPTI